MDTTTLPQLHQIIQLAMGWQDYHLHQFTNQFTINGVEYGQPLPDYDLGIRNEKTVKLNQFVSGEKFKFFYTYDMGDGWDHEILVEKIVPPKASKHYSTCITGKRACPPEDCGGVWRYAEFVAAIQDSAHPEHEEMLEWVESLTPISLISMQ